VNARQPVRIVITILMMLSVMAGSGLAETVFVLAKTAQLRAGKTSLDPVVANVKYGEALQVRKSEGKWMEVETQTGVTGWIFANKTTTVKPSGSDDELSRLGRSVRGKEASDTTASAGARGLDKASESYANSSRIPQRYRDAVDRMTAYKVTDQEVEDFLKKGELSEYAK
jgi:Bacterial SH3 domain